MVNPLPIAITTDEKRFLMESAVLMRDSGRLDQAAVMFEAIVSLVDDRHLPLIGLGSVEFERGAFERAVERFEDAVAFAPDCALAHAHLGEALAFSRHLEEAQLALRKATELDPAGTAGGNMARQIQKFLDYGLL
ncbi:MAG: hypothetical protein R3E12_00135 [Candidatus Eisenbacteria bacterium]|uniref:Tetratricopeptide repeat protein n=1 Tax=Eiseniibacteriota bacterium TaxID=2212470 RepID=A0A956RND9_UNCEI|nr:hypothetical protein [Candidatus Eisenbacteria bacterium]